MRGHSPLCRGRYGSKLLRGGRCVQMVCLASHFGRTGSRATWLFSCQMSAFCSLGCLSALLSVWEDETAVSYPAPSFWMDLARGKEKVLLVYLFPWLISYKADWGCWLKSTLPLGSFHILYWSRTSVARWMYLGRLFDCDNCFPDQKYLTLWNRWGQTKEKYFFCSLSRKTEITSGLYKVYCTPTHKETCHTRVGYILMADIKNHLHNNGFIDNYITFGVAFHLCCFFICLRSSAIVAQLTETCLGPSPFTTQG